MKHLKVFAALKGRFIYIGSYRKLFQYALLNSLMEYRFVLSAVSLYLFHFIWLRFVEPAIYEFVA